MGYGLQIPAHQLGGPKRVLWDFWGYGLSNAWVMRVSTVNQNGYNRAISSLPWPIYSPVELIDIKYKARY
jgi:hypothetical protein